MNSASDSQAAFLIRHKLPPEFRRLVDNHYEPLATWLSKRDRQTSPLIVGINGAQGTGKSTLAQYLKMDLSRRGLSIAVLSLDDFYLTRSERRMLAERHHPLLATRGVPGTHDIALLQQSIACLQQVSTTALCTLPRFDKSSDDRAPSDTWSTVRCPVDIILFEGWCVGSKPQSRVELAHPINDLERVEDSDGVWRGFVNTRLREEYSAVFSLIDVQIFLQAPDFDSIYRWRLEQEQKLQEEKLAESVTHSADATMSAEQIARFIHIYERLTRANLDRMPGDADAILTLDADHTCTAHRFR